MISHFYNEEYLLPWWLVHHREIFDFGVMIDYGSTDGSKEIIKSLVPHWKVIPSRNNNFEAQLVDSEVSDYEEALPTGWKTALNVTEYISFRDLENSLIAWENSELEIIRIPGYEIVGDRSKVFNPTYETKLIDAITNGMSDSPALPKILPGRGRFFHRKSSLQYGVGRHTIQDEFSTVYGEASVLHLLSFPWNQNFIQRRLQIGARIPQSDLDKGFGVNHTSAIQDYEKFIDPIEAASIDLRNDPNFVATVMQRNHKPWNGAVQTLMVEPYPSDITTNQIIFHIVEINFTSLRIDLVVQLVNSFDFDIKLTSVNLNISKKSDFESWDLLPNKVSPHSSNILKISLAHTNEIKIITKNEFVAPGAFQISADKIND